jgi:hypothetical protein
MNTPIRFLVLLSILAPSAAFGAEEKKPAPSADAAKALVAGDYAGMWKSSGSATGKLNVKLKPHGEGWGAEASFTFEESTIATKMKSVKVDGTKVELVFEWDSRGTPSESKLTGEATGDKLAGTFESKTGDNLSSGTWSVTRAAPSQPAP